MNLQHRCSSSLVPDKEANLVLLLIRQMQRGVTAHNLRSANLRNTYHTRASCAMRSHAEYICITYDGPYYPDSTS